MKKMIFLSLLVVITAFSYLSTNFEPPKTATAQQTVAASDEGQTQTEEATEARATTDREKPYHLPSYLTDRPERIVNHSSMTISWNERLRLPNYVAWILTEDRVNGNVKRLDDFQPDPDVEDSPTWADYRGSGYDRGHLCPAADNKHTMQAQKECFYMTNMCPQTHSLNAGDWSQIEELCRKWAKQYGKLYIVSGPIVSDEYQTVGDTRIAIPQAFFKVVMRRGEYGAKAIGFICENGNQNLNPRDYVVTVDSVEAVTGINFYSKLTKAEERKAEASYNLKDWKGI